MSDLLQRAQREHPDLFTSANRPPPPKQREGLPEIEQRIYQTVGQVVRKFVAEQLATPRTHRTNDRQAQAVQARCHALRKDRRQPLGDHQFRMQANVA
jgi:hypothetical protein